MTTEAIPKYLFIDESTEELYDKRIKKYTTFEEDHSGKTKRIDNYHFINQLSLPTPIAHQIQTSHSIHNTCTSPTT